MTSLLDTLLNLALEYGFPATIVILALGALVYFSRKYIDQQIETKFAKEQQAYSTATASMVSLQSASHPKTIEACLGAWTKFMELESLVGRIAWLASIRDSPTRKTQIQQAKNQLTNSHQAIRDFLTEFNLLIAPNRPLLGEQIALEFEVAVCIVLRVSEMLWAYAIHDNEMSWWREDDIIKANVKSLGKRELREALEDVNVPFQQLWFSLRACMSERLTAALRGAQIGEHTYDLARRLAVVDARQRGESKPNPGAPGWGSRADQ